MELVKIHASQINGCAVCLHMQTTSARKLGETEERLYLLDAWSESPLYSEREHAATSAAQLDELKSSQDAAGAPAAARNAPASRLTRRSIVTHTA
jgi:AhpD family alkylhydroperoxidase